MDETNEEFVVTKGVTEVYLVSAKDAKDAEDAVDAGKAVLVQRRSSTNSQPKPTSEPAPSSEVAGLTTAQVVRQAVDKSTAKPSG